VGASVAISVLHAGIAQELLLHDIKTEVAEGEAMDLSHGSSFYPSAQVRSSTVDEMHDATAIVVAAGRGGRPGESRLDLLKDNARMIRDLRDHPPEGCDESRHRSRHGRVAAFPGAWRKSRAHGVSGSSRHAWHS
jgi:malate/lactate dehydrogenase